MYRHLSEQLDIDLQSSPAPSVERKNVGMNTEEFEGPQGDVIRHVLNEQTTDNDALMVSVSTSFHLFKKWLFCMI